MVQTYCYSATYFRDRQNFIYLIQTFRRPFHSHYVIRLHHSTTPPGGEGCRGRLRSPTRSELRANRSRKSWRSREAGAPVSFGETDEEQSQRRRREPCAEAPKIEKFKIFNIFKIFVKVACIAVLLYYSVTFLSHPAVDLRVLPSFLPSLLSVIVAVLSNSHYTRFICMQTVEYIIVIITCILSCCLLFTSSLLPCIKSLSGVRL